MQRAALVASVTLIAIGVVPWTDFQGHPHWQKVGWVPFRSDPVAIRLRDIVINVLLFTPLGASVASLSRSGSALSNAAMAGAGLSLTAEWVQLYSHSRFPSATDLVTNIAGAVLGATVLLTSRRP